MGVSRDYDVPVGTLRREDLSRDFVEKFQHLAFQLQLCSRVGVGHVVVPALLRSSPCRVWPDDAAPLAGRLPEVA